MRNFLINGLHFDWKIVTITIISTLLLMVDAYHRITPESWGITQWKAVDRTFLYLVIPLLITLLVLHENPRKYGFTLGDWRAGLVITFLACVLIAPVLWVVAHGDSTMQDYYKDQVNGLPWNTFLDLLGWEYIFRGWILFGYSRKFGADALWLQAVPFAMAHIGKPEVETISTIFGGFAFGWVAWRTKSFVYPLLIHWFVASFTILVAAGVLG